MSCNAECSNYSVAVKHTAGAALTTGTPVVIPTVNGRTNVYTHLTVVNDSDQDILVKYITVQGYAGEFYVPRSIKGFTRSVKDKFDISSFKVESAGAASATGSIYFNFAN
jgi:hypothetical protein